MTAIKRLLDYLGITIVILLAAAVLVILSPVLIVVFSLDVKRDRRKEQEFSIAYNEFLRSADSTKFICYTNKRKTLPFIKEQLMPCLKKSVNEIFLEGKTLHTTYDHNFISRLLINVGSRGGFPILIKISNGQMTSRSINTELHDAMNTHKDVERLLSCIEEFFGDGHSIIPKSNWRKQ